MKKKAHQFTNTYFGEGARNVVFTCYIKKTIAKLYSTVPKSENNDKIFYNQITFNGKFSDVKFAEIDRRDSENYVKLGKIVAKILKINF